MIQGIKCMRAVENYTFVTCTKMRVFSVALFALLGVGVNAASADEFVAREFDSLELFGNVVDKLMNEGFEYARQILKSYEPLALPDLPAQTVVDNDVNLSFQLTNVKILNASNFVVKKLHNNLDSLEGEFEIVLPTVHLESNYTVSGTAFNEDVNGTGVFSVDLTNFVQGGQVKLAVTNNSLQMNSLDLQYSLDDAQFHLTGLQTTTMSDEQIEQYLNQQLLSTIKAHQAYVSEKVASHVIEIANQILDGKTLFDTIKWLKNIIKNQEN